MVFNKKSVPLYIDWNKSSLIVNSAKVPYWKDNTITKSRFKSDTRYYEVYPNYPLSSYAEYFLKRQYGLSESVTVRPERITVIPPQAQWFKVEYNLCIMDIYPTAPYKKVTLERTRQTDGKDKQVNGDSYSVEFSADKSPLLFSNFLTLSYSENFSNEFYITNQFYVSRIIEMDKRFYKGILVNQKFNYPYITSTSFSKLIPYNLTMEYNAIHCDYVSHSGRRCTFSKVKGSNFCKTHSK